MRATLFSLAALAASISVSASGAVFERDWKSPGDGLLTYDYVNQREWLDLTESVLSQFGNGRTDELFFHVAFVETLPSGKFAGFSLANGADVKDLAQSAGIDTLTLNYAANGSQAEALIQLLGSTHEELANVRSWGALPGSGRDAQVTAFVSVNGTAQAGLSFMQTNRSDYGVWLYRQVPEPSTFFLSGMALIALVFLRHRPHQQLAA